MGKIDDMRRQREQQYANAGQSPTAEKKTTSVSKSGAAIDEQGKCPECGKTKPMNNGLLANHQKGFGKACAGSRKKPV